MAIIKKVIALFIFLGLILVCVAAGYVAQKDYQTALDVLVAEALARAENRPALELDLYRQDETGLHETLEYLLQSDAASFATAYSGLGDVLATRSASNTPSRQAPSLETIRSNLSITDTGLVAFDSEQKLADTGFWSSLRASKPTAHLTAPIYSPANAAEKSLETSNFEEADDPAAVEAAASSLLLDADNADQPQADISLAGEETSSSVATTIYRVNVGGPQYTDSSGNLWSADSFFNTGKGGGELTGDIAETSDPTLYRTERWDIRVKPELMYTLPVSNGLYKVRLHFAEVYNGASTPGARIFNVEIEGVTALSNYDIVADVGFRTAVVKEFSDVVVSDGKLDIEFLHVRENPNISALEVIQYSEPDTLDVDASTGPQDSGDALAGPGSQQTATPSSTDAATPQISNLDVSSNTASAVVSPVSASSTAADGRRSVIGFIHLAIDQSTLLHDSRIAASRVFFGGLFLLFLCTPAVYLIMKRTTTPLRKLTHMVNQIAAGESPEKVNVKESNALGDIAKFLNGVIDGSAEHYTQVDLDHKLLAEKADENASQLSRSEEELIKATQEINSNREQLHRLANYDRLTSLPNRQLFAEQLGLLLRLCARNAKPLALLLLKLEDFKRINESLGRNAGDLLLQEVGKRLVSCVRDSDMLVHHAEAEEEINVSRLGSDEFALVLTQLDTIDAAGMVAKRITDRLAEPMSIDGQELVVTSNIGIAVAPRNGMDVEGLFRAADTAVHHTKSSDSSFLFYKEDMVSTGQDDLKMEAELRKAIERNQLSLHYQPQVDTKDGSIICAEALLRWEHPEYGQVSPARFIHLAEKIGLIWELGDWVLVEACRQMNAFREQGLELPRIAINVSPLQFKPEFVVRLREVLEAAKLPPSTLELGLSEAVLMDNDSSVLHFLQELKETGIYLSLENFGTSHAPISYLSRHPLDEIKLDRKFVIDCDKRKDAGSLVKAIIAMSASLELRTVAEGVETEGEYRFLAENGISAMRGYLFSPPVPAAELQKLLVVPWHFMGQLQRIALMDQLGSSGET